MSIWISRESYLTFRFAGSRPPAINRRWVEALSFNAARTGGMQVISEDQVESAFAAHRASLASPSPADSADPTEQES